MIVLNYYCKIIQYAIHDDIHAIVQMHTNAITAVVFCTFIFNWVKPLFIIFIKKERISC